MTALSDLLRERMPEGWNADDVVRAAGKAGHEINRATVYAYLGGKHATTPRETVLEAFAAALPVRINELRTAATLPAGELEPWHPPRTANRLSTAQRRVLEQLITVMTTEQQDARRRHLAPVAQDQPVADPGLKAARKRRTRPTGDEPEQIS